MLTVRAELPYEQNGTQQLAILNMSRFELWFTWYISSANLTNKFLLEYGFMIFSAYRKGA